VARRLPRFVVLADGDNTLPVDLLNALAVESFVQLVKDRDEAALDELFPGPHEQPAHGPEGRFVHELIVPFVSSAAPVRPSASDAAVPGPPLGLAPLPRARRSFPPGSEWLYVKLYSATATADAVLRELVGPLVRQTLGSGHVDRWFFIRYHDPDPHLRLRFQGAPESLERHVWPALRAAAAAWLDDGRIRRLALDTYEREIERYGGQDGIELAERLFHADSEAVLEIVERLDPGDAGLDERWRLTFCGMHLLLEDLGIDLHARAALLQEIRAASATEQRFDHNLERRVGDAFRRERARLEALLHASPAGDDALAPGLLALGRRSRRLRTVVAALREREAAGLLSAPRRALAVSFLHMHANRLLRSAQREQEAVLHDFLARHYESAVARERAVAASSS
jgi:thiopeptide-type bacteriocin biosynthesis protein